MTSHQLLHARCVETEISPGIQQHPTVYRTSASSGRWIHVIEDHGRGGQEHHGPVERLSFAVLADDIRGSCRNENDAKV